MAQDSKRMNELAASVTLTVWSRVAIIFSAFVLTVAVPVAGWIWGEIWDGVKEVKRVQQINHLEASKEIVRLEGRVNGHDAQIGELDRRVSNMEFKVNR